MDNTVFNAIVDLYLEDDGKMIDRDSLVQHLERKELTIDAITESVEIFEADGRISLQRTLGGTWWIKDMPHRTLLEASSARAMDIPAMQSRLLTEFVNNPRQAIRTFEDQPRIITRAIVNDFASRGLIKIQGAFSGEILILGVSASAVRMVRRS